MSFDQMTVAALGQPFTLGMLYDARKNELIPGYSLWDQTALTNNTTQNAQHSSAFQVTVSDSIESRTSLLDIGASLKLSFLSGLVEVEGSAKYLSDQKKYQNQSRVTCQYKATTHFKQLSINSLGPLNDHQMEVVRMGLATHVVTGILYGANAFFVFDSEKLDASSVQKIQGSMEAVIKKIPSFDVDGSVRIDLTDEEKKLTNKFSCKFYGDLLLESNPATFEDAVKTYVSLPHLLGPNGENAAPVKIWLMSLKNFDSEAAEMMANISVGLVRQIEDTLQDGREVVMRCNDSLDGEVGQSFPEMSKAFNTFQTECHYYISSLRQTVAQKVPAIREGKEDETELKKLLDDRKTSPFSHDKLCKWLDYKEREVTVIGSCIDMMKGTNVRVIKNQTELDREVFAVDDALCFAFTSIETSDPFLDEMSRHLKSSQLEATNKVPWYYSDAVIAYIKEKANAFHDIAKALRNSSSFRFLLAPLSNENYTGASIYQYKNGILISDNFSKPEVSQVETITDRRDLIWYACDLSLDPATANNYLSLSEENKKATCSGTWNSYPDVPERFDSFPEIMCREGLTGCHYWEMQWSQSSRNSVGVAVTYKGIPRKGKVTASVFGFNNVSWFFGEKETICAMHNGQYQQIPVPPTGLGKVGVYLDCPGGTLSFYTVSSDSLHHLYTFRDSFTEPLFPGFWVLYDSNYVFLSPF